MLFKFRFLYMIIKQLFKFHSFFLISNNTVCKNLKIYFILKNIFLINRNIFLINIHHEFKYS